MLRMINAFPLPCPVTGAMTVHLASASERRKLWLSDFLAEHQVEFSAGPLISNDESVPSGLLVSEMVGSILKSKVEAAKIEFSIAVNAGQTIPQCIIVADTLVEDPDDAYAALGQPATREAAAAMLIRLSGRAHNVWSGTAILQRDEGEWKVSTAIERAVVEIEELTPESILHLLDSGSWRGKAGGYDLAGEMGNHAKLVGGELVTVLGLAPSIIKELESFIS